ncbi:MAG: hypothetical protein JXO51_07470 [Candidatus Aminicenantes bacterium]|nr:hypothetical protein [Candidatus Aminicenantes bacterium]
MAAISWNDIQANAVAFAHDWKGASDESADAQSFWNDFFEIFGVQRRQVGSFEAAVQKLGSKHKGRIDLFWPGKLIVEHKSRGKDFYAAFLQAVDYLS